MDRANVPLKTGSIYPAPYGAMMAGRTSLRFGEAGGLTQFGANLVMLDPGARSSLRHWHQHEDEFAYVTEGQLHLLEDGGDTKIQAGDCAAFPAGVANGHCFENRSSDPAAFLVIGSRARVEFATYSDIDLTVALSAGTAVFTHKDGRPYVPPL
ncbi:transcriptional regulator [Pseudoruegeria sp. SK021]|nr:transcriptional regulator [Pseudoruegeria sp. SK021]